MDTHRLLAPTLLHAWKPAKRGETPGKVGRKMSESLKKSRAHRETSRRDPNMDMAPGKNEGRGGPWRKAAQGQWAALRGCGQGRGPPG